MQIVDNQDVKLVGSNTLVIKNKKDTKYTAINLLDVSAVELEKQDQEGIQTSTLILFILVLPTLIIYGLGLVILTIALYKYYKLDKITLLKIYRRDRDKIMEIILPKLDDADIDYLFHQISIRLEQPSATK